MGEMVLCRAPQLILETPPVGLQVVVPVVLVPSELLLVAARYLQERHLAPPRVEDPCDEAGPEDERLLEAVQQGLRCVDHLTDSHGACPGHHVRAEVAVEVARAGVRADRAGHVRQAGLLKHPCDLVALVGSLDSAALAVRAQLAREVADLRLDDPGQLQPVPSLRLHGLRGLRQLLVDLRRQTVFPAPLLHDDVLQLSHALAPPLGFVLQSFGELPALLQRLLELAPLRGVGLVQGLLYSRKLVLL
mmetsp:Transcript_123315/g.308015  ORF Transcript_123315/g.308015 Transcript_123315/m.308015 type:complete len:247 (-) Transcript_123315:974-1714(-)